MKVYSKILITLGIICLGIPARPQNADLFFKASGSPANPKVQASWNKYYTYDGITDLCRRLAKE